MVTVVVIHSSHGGHTTAVARAVVDGAAEVEGTVTDLLEVGVDQIDWTRLQAADGVVFGSPVHVGGPSARMVGFGASSSALWETSAWRDVVASAFAVSGAMEGGKHLVMQYFFEMAMQHSMLWVGLDQRAGWNTSAGSPHDPNRLGYRAGAGVQCDLDVGPDGIVDSDLQTARGLGRRVAEVAVATQALRAATSSNPTGEGR